MKEKDVQILAMEKLEFDGWTYWFPPRTWGERDIMGAFDFIAFRKRQTILVQLTTIQHLSDRRKKIAAICVVNSIAPRGMEIWAWDKRQLKFRVFKIHGF